jgi:glycosyltransferase involved in cell wall biosynthesis
MPGKVLIITYYWPPSGGAGVQRWLKFAKYLPSTGWIPVVLTVQPEYAAYPFRDESLIDEIPVDIEVRKTKATNYFSFYSKDQSKIPSGGFANNQGKGIKSKISRFVRGNLFIPDPRRGWNRFAIKEASEIIREEGITHVITTSPPHSTQLIGLKLKKRFPHISWIADLRDSWTDIYYYDMFYPTLLSRAIDSHFEKSVIQNADKLITVGHNLAEIFSSKAENVSSKFIVVPNGFDEEDFEGINSSIPERFTITYVGTFSEVYPIEGLFSALTSLEKKGRDFLVRFVGSFPDEVKERISKLVSRDKTEFIGYIEHPKAIKLMAASSLLVIIIPETKENQAITPGKVFEYIALQKPVLYIGPTNGDAAFHLRHCGYKGIFEPRDFEGMQSFIIKMMDSNSSGKYYHHFEYSRRTLTNTLAGVLNGK